LFQCKEDGVRTSLALVLVVPTLALVGCSSDIASLSLAVTPGHEQSAFSTDPAVTRVDVEARSLDGSVAVKVSSAPGGSFDLGEVPIDQQVSFEVSGVSAAGEVVVRGRSLTGLAIGGIGGTLPIFAQRLGAWARPPGSLLRAHVGGAAGIVGERYLLSSGGSAVDEMGAEADGAESDFYDLLVLDGALGGKLPRAAKTMVARGMQVLLIDDQGASWVDFEAGTTLDVGSPTGLSSFGEVAGGRVVEGSDGLSFVVGGTRAASASDAVLVMDAQGKLSLVRSKAARAGAAAVWVEGVGLLLAGGSATGAGVEVLAKGASAFVEKGYAPDAVEGAAAVVTGAGDVALLGGMEGGMGAPVRRFSPGCGSGCSVDAGMPLPAGLLGVEGYGLSGGRAVVVGSEAEGDGLMRCFVVDFGGTTAEIELREPRKGGSVTPTPHGLLAILGGVHANGSPATTVELLFPE